MKLLLLILAFLVAAPPVQAGVCDMEKNQDTTGHASMQYADREASGHGCCDHENEEQEEKEDSCCDVMPCGQCSLGISAILALTDHFLDWNTAHRHGFAGGSHLSTHSSPPFRPPIS